MKTMKIAMFVCLFGLFVCHFPSPRAATLVRLSLEGLVSYSDIAVIGTPLQVKTLRNEQGRIVRDVTFKVDEYVTGGGTDRIVVRLMGGTLDGVSQYVPGEIKLELGNNVLLFLEQASSTTKGVYLVTGMAQGRFHIVKNSTTGERFVTRTLGDINLVGQPLGKDVYGLAREETSTFVPLEEFLRTVRALAQTTPKVRP